MSARDNGGPAFPEPGLSGLPNGEFIYGNSGMSLRDYFATRAPVDIPTWFRIDYPTPRPAFPKHTLTRAQYEEWNEMGCDEMSDPAILAWDRQYKESKKALEDHDRDLEVTTYFAWRYAYADAMLAERAK